jgi:hypothetical protein
MKVNYAFNIAPDKLPSQFSQRSGHVRKRPGSPIPPVNGKHTMKGHLYRLTLEHLEDSKGNPVEKPPLQFEVKNHDDLYSIVEKVQAKGLFDANESAAFAIGLKLFREVMLHHRDAEVFKELDPHFSEFMKAFKKL